MSRDGGFFSLYDGLYDVGYDTLALCGWVFCGLELVHHFLF